MSYLQECNCHECTQARWKMSAEYQQQEKGKKAAGLPYGSVITEPADALPNYLRMSGPICEMAPDEAARALDRQKSEVEDALSRLRGACATKPKYKAVLEFGSSEECATFLMRLEDITNESPDADPELLADAAKSVRVSGNATEEVKQ